MTYDQDWDRRLNPFRYNADGSLTDSAKRQNVTMELNSAGGSGGTGGAGGQVSVQKAVLNKASTALDDLRTDTDKVDQKAIDETSDASASALDDWQYGLGLDSMLKRWGDGASNLSVMLSDAASKLHNTAAFYMDTDHTEKSRMDSLNGRRS
ncbi:hypothetical protein [Streptomyces sp. NPDC058773]|uniref:hypothetical protein n=1 Tax=Streptomyces sp. NPDC058773 TaxID=3346632 RepID=UPI0036BB1EF6